MKTNEQLQKDVQDAIKWQPLLKAAEVGVTAKDGVVSLTKGVLGVKAVVEFDQRFRNSVGVSTGSSDFLKSFLLRVTITQAPPASAAKY